MKNFFVGMFLTVALVGSNNAHAEDKKAAAAAGLDSAVINESVMRGMPAFQECVKKEKAGVKGKMTAKFVISGEGKVTQASAADSTLNNAPFEACILDAIKGLTFPEPAGHGNVDVTYPFSFEKKSKAEKHSEKAEKKSKKK